MKEHYDLYIPKERRLFEKGKSLFIFDQIDGGVSVETLLWIGQKENDDEVEQLDIYLNSPGGDLWGCICIAQAIRNCTKPVRTVAVGKAYSGAALILMSGDAPLRTAWPKSRIMLHEISIHGHVGHTSSELQKWTKDVVEMNEIWLNCIAEMTGQPIDKVREDIKKDLYLTPVEALEYGIVDVIEPIGKKRLTFDPDE